jgi:hypothetical protein
MWPLRLLISLAGILICSAAGANQNATSTPSPLGELQMQIEALDSRIEALEQAAPDSIVDKRTYCMMVDVALLRGWSVDSTEIVETIVVRRVLTFSGGAFTATLVSSNRNIQNDNGVVTPVVGISPVLLEGTYIQSGNQLDLSFTTGSTASWYVSADGSVIHNNDIDFLGPFPNSLTIGIVRSSTMIESATCDAAG